MLVLIVRNPVCNRVSDFVPQDVYVSFAPNEEWSKF